VVDPSEVERVDGIDELPVSAATCVLPVADARFV
jgi:hypothetical protein